MSRQQTKKNRFLARKKARSAKNFFAEHSSDDDDNRDRLMLSYTTVSMTLSNRDESGRKVVNNEPTSEFSGKFAKLLARVSSINKLNRLSCP